MAQNEKDLLLKDLCSRLPYGVKVSYKGKIYQISIVSICNETITIYGEKGYPIEVQIKDCKPCLFPLLSMANQQLEELRSYMIKDSYGILYHTPESYDYLYKNNIDIRGLIPMGLANDATGKNIY